MRHSKLKEEFKRTYMRTAFLFSEHSKAIRLKTGAIIVKDDSIISYGYNGTLPGADNTCEYKVYSYDDSVEHPDGYPYEDCDGNYRLVTKPDVIHAEMNAIVKLARKTMSGEGAALFVTHSPCVYCAGHIIQSGITHVYYNQVYRLTDGLELLADNGVKVEQVIL